MFPCGKCACCLTVNHFKDLISSRHLIRHSARKQYEAATCRRLDHPQARIRVEGRRTERVEQNVVKRLVQLTMHTVRVPAMHTDTFHCDIEFPIVRKHIFLFLFIDAFCVVFTVDGKLSKLLE